MIINFFGWAAGLFGITLGIFQLHRILESRSVKGVSLTMWQLYFGVQVGWIVHGLVERNQPMIWASLGCALMALIVLNFYAQYKPKRSRWIKKVPSNWQIFGLAVTVAIILSLVAWRTSSEVKGLVFIFPTTFGQIHQLVQIYQAKSLSGLSVTMLLIYNFNQGLLLIWSFLLNDRTLMITATTSMIILAIAIISYYYKLKSFKRHII